MLVQAPVLMLTSGGSMGLLPLGLALFAAEPVGSTEEDQGLEGALHRPGSPCDDDGSDIRPRPQRKLTNEGVAPGLSHAPSTQPWETRT